MLHETTSTQETLIPNKGAPNEGASYYSATSPTQWQRPLSSSGLSFSTVYRLPTYEKASFVRASFLYVFSS